MAEAATSYPFSSGDRLDDRNTYFYSPFGGQGFLEAWRADRDRLAATLPPATQAPPDAEPVAFPAAEPTWKTAQLCEYLYSVVAQKSGKPDAESAVLLEQLIRKFETTKRIHSAYRQADFRAVDPKNYQDTALYLRAAEIFEAAFATIGWIQSLNALLKILDTLTGLAPSLDRAQGARLARLIAAERRHVESIALRMGVAP